MLNEATISKIKELIKTFPTPLTALPLVLRIIEEDLGYIPDEAIPKVAEILSTSPAHVKGFLSFYTHYKRPYHGKYRIQVCGTYPCAMKGSLKIADYIKNKLKIDFNQTTPDGKFSIEKVECLAQCDKAPVMMINDKLFTFLTPEKVDDILNNIEKYMEEEE